MSKCSQLGALMQKNLILMKRNCCTTACEIFFPIVLMLLLVLVRRAVVITAYGQPSNDMDFMFTNSTALITKDDMLTRANSQNLSYSNWNGLTIRQPL